MDTPHINIKEMINVINLGLYFIIKKLSVLGIIAKEYQMD